MIRLPILNERQFFDSPMVVGAVPSMLPIALASRELSRRGTFKVSLLRKAALWKRPQLAWRLLTSQMLVVHLYMKFKWNSWGKSSCLRWYCNYFIWQMLDLWMCHMENRLNNMWSINIIKWMIAWMFQLPGRLLFDKLHGGSNQVNPLEVKQSCWEVRKKPVLEVGRSVRFGSFSGNVGLCESVSHFHEIFKHSMSQKTQGFFFQPWRPPAPDVIRPPCHWVFFDGFLLSMGLGLSRTMAQLMRRGPGSPERNPAQQRIDFGGRRSHGVCVAFEGNHQKESNNKHYHYHYHYYSCYFYYYCCYNLYSTTTTTATTTKATTIIPCLFAIATFVATTTTAAPASATMLLQLVLLKATAARPTTAMTTFPNFASLRLDRNVSSQVPAVNSMNIFTIYPKHLVMG